MTQNGQKIASKMLSPIRLTMRSSERRDRVLLLLVFVFFILGTSRSQWKTVRAVNGKLLTRAKVVGKVGGR